MGSIATVRTGHDIAANTGGAAWTAVTQRATIGEAGANGIVGVQVSDAVALVRALAVLAGELALEQLAATPNGAKGIAADNEGRGTRRHHVASAGPDFLGQRFIDSSLGFARC